MGLRSPQSMNRVNPRQQGSIRFQGTTAPKLDKTFLQTASKAVSAQQEEARKQQVEKLEFARKTADIAAEEETVKAKAELTQYTGLEASNKSISIRERLQKKLEDKKNAFPSEYHPYIDLINRDKMLRFNKTAIPYSLGELKKVKDETEKTYVSNAMMETIEDSGNPYEFNTRLAKVKFLLGEKAKKQFGNVPELIEEAQRTGISKTLVGAVEQQAVLGRLDNAENILSSFNDDLTPDDREKALKILDKNRRNIETINAERIAAKASEFEDPIKAEEFVRNSVDSHQGYSAAMATLRSIKGAQEKGKKLSDAKIVTEVFKDLSSNRGLDPHKLNAIQDINTKNKIIDQINKYGGIENRITDKQVYKRLVSDMFHNSEKFKNENLEQFQLFLSPDDYKFVTDRQMAMKDLDVKRQEKIDFSTDKLIKDLAQATIEDAVSASEIDDEEKMELYRSMMDFQDRLIRNSKGMSERDIRRVFAERAAKFKISEQKVPGILNLGGLLPWGYEKKVNTYIPTFDHTEEEIEKVRGKRPDWDNATILKFLDHRRKLK